MRQGAKGLRRLCTAAGVAALACGGGGDGAGDRSGFLGGAGIPGRQTARACDGSCDPGVALSAPQVMTIVDQAAREMQARARIGVVAVVDRVGNPLAVWKTNGPPLSILISSKRPDPVQVPLTSFQNGLENTLLAAEFGALSKAITGAYLSSQGNAFSTRTANYIVHSNFPPNSANEVSGPLFGVQFSQLPCGDWVRRDDPMPNASGDAFDGIVDGRAGPKRSPLGLAADPGGFPLYIDGVLVGGIGVVVQEGSALDDRGATVAVSIYGVEGDPFDLGPDVEEEIAMAAMRGFEPNDNRLASAIAVSGRFLRYSNSPRDGRARSPMAAGLVSALPAGGSLLAVPGFYDGTRVFAGVRVGTPESGIVAASGSVAGPAPFGADRAGRPISAQILVNPDGTPFLGRGSGAATNPRDSIAPAAGIGLTRDEVARLLAQALAVAQEARAQIRQPGGSSAQVNVHVCDRDGNDLGYVRGPDAPLFGSDVALQKCRSAALFSRGSATAPPGSEATASAADLLLQEDRSFAASGVSAAGRQLGIPNGVRNTTMARYLQRLRDFIPAQTALADGTAWANRSLGNLARPCFPDGVNCAPDGRGGVRSGAALGPLSVDGDPRRFSPLSDGFQLEYAKDYALDGALGRTLGVREPARCGSLSGNGLQIFPGSVPIFARDVDAAGKPGTRVYQVGALGVSGDGIDQDDLVAFMAVDRASRAPNSRVSNAPPSLRSDRIRPQPGGGTNLRYVSCPASPYNDPFRSEQSVCEGR